MSHQAVRIHGEQGFVSDAKIPVEIKRRLIDGHQVGMVEAVPGKTRTGKGFHSE